MAIELFLPMIPPTATHQEKKVAVKKGKPRLYEDQRLSDARQKLRAHLGQHRPRNPLEGAVALLTVWNFPAGGKHKDGAYRTTKPDTDNLQKLLKDCMTAEGFWQDDAQVCDERIIKRWAETPGIFIWAETI